MAVRQSGFPKGLSSTRRCKPRVKSLHERRRRSIKKALMHVQRDCKRTVNANSNFLRPLQKMSRRQAESVSESKSEGPKDVTPLGGRGSRRLILPRIRLLPLGFSNIGARRSAPFGSRRGAEHPFCPFELPRDTDLSWFVFALSSRPVATAPASAISPHCERGIHQPRACGGKRGRGAEGSFCPRIRILPLGFPKTGGRRSASV